MLLRPATAEGLSECNQLGTTGKRRIRNKKIQLQSLANIRAIHANYQKSDVATACVGSTCYPFFFRRKMALNIYVCNVARVFYLSYARNKPRVDEKYEALRCHISRTIRARLKARRGISRKTYSRFLSLITRSLVDVTLLLLKLR